jgi:hypothetical protein
LIDHIVVANMADRHPGREQELDRGLDLQEIGTLNLSTCLQSYHGHGELGRHAAGPAACR